MSEIVSVKIIASASGGMFGSGIHEARLLDGEGNRITNIYVPVSDLKERGVIKRSNHMGKSEKWLNTQEGLKYINELFERVMAK